MPARFKAVRMRVTFNAQLIVEMSGLNFRTAVLMEGCLMVTDLADIGGGRYRIGTGIIAKYAGLIIKYSGHSVKNNLAGTARGINSFLNLLDVGRFRRGMAPVTVFVLPP